MTDQTPPDATDIKSCQGCGHKLYKTARKCPYCAAPQIIFPASYAANNPQNWKQLFFSANGRIGRQQWWICRLVLLAPLVVLVFLSVLVGQPSASDTRTAQAVLGSTVLIYLIPCIWSVLCVDVKRWHDLNFSGWMQLIVLIACGEIIAVVINGFLCGTQGPNRFGPDPLAKQ